MLSELAFGARETETRTIQEIDTVPPDSGRLRGMRAL